MVCINKILFCLCRNCRKSHFPRHVPEHRCSLTARLRSPSHSEPRSVLFHTLSTVFCQFPLPHPWPSRLSCISLPAQPRTTHHVCAGPFSCGSHRAEKLQSRLERRNRAYKPPEGDARSSKHGAHRPYRARRICRHRARDPGRAPIRRRGSGPRRRRVTRGRRSRTEVAAHAHGGCRGSGARRSP